MILVVSLVMSVISGFLAHLSRPILRRDFGKGWFSIACYSEGVLLALPFAAINYVTLKRNELAGLIASYLLAFLGIGTGVVVGHYFRPDRNQNSFS